MHDNEPKTIAELALIYSELIRVESSNENMAKIHIFEKFICCKSQAFATDAKPSCK